MLVKSSFLSTHFPSLVVHWRVLIHFASSLCFLLDRSSIQLQKDYITQHPPMHHPFETYIMTHMLNLATTSELHENVTLT